VISGYPAHREADVVLRDGSTVRLRPVRRGDEAALLRFFESLGVESQAFRFFSGAPDLEQTAALMADVDYAGRYGLLASRGDDERLVGHGVYVDLAPDAAEVAFAITEGLQTMGLGTILLAHLAQVAEENGISTFVAEVLPQNHRMIEVFRESGFPVETRSTASGIRLTLPTSFSPEAVARFADRDRVAAEAAVRHFLEPRAVAVIGASRRRGTVGGEVLHNMVESGFEGELYAVNPNSDSVQGVAAYPAIAAVPGEVDLAVIAIPAGEVVKAARECAAKGVRGLLVLSAGFGETGKTGARRERQLLEVCREAGMRLVGPNCLGVLNNLPGRHLNATFSPTPPRAGEVGFVTQSGALGLALMEFAGEPGLGVSSFASVGNRADITANDVLEYWESDAATRVALLYIESFSDPRRFSRVAPRVGRKMPVVVVKSGRSASGVRAAGSHTGALVASSDGATDALFEQSGVIRTETLEELLDVAALLSSQPLPEGPRVGIVTNAGGPGIMCADACEAAGLEVPELPRRLRAKLRLFLPAEAGLGNPVDMIATASPEDYERTIAALAEWDGIDALIAIFIRPLQTAAEEVAAAIGAAAERLSRPIPLQAVFMTPSGHEVLAERAGVPTHVHPEDAARALGKAVRHQRWRQRPRAEPPSFDDTRGDEAAAVISEALADGREWLTLEGCARLLDCYGIAMPEARVVPGRVEAGAAAAELGGAVALKAQGPQIIHKTELGAVRVGLEGGQEVSRAAARMEESLGAAGVSRESFLVQRMVPEGVELLVGIAADPVFGPVLACGAGGTTAELLKDVSVKVCPIAPVDATEMLRRLAIFPMLTGFRGAAPADVGAVEELLLRVSAMAEAHREIVELDLNPVLAGPAGAVAADARIRVAASAPPRPWPRTWA
jgi:acetyl coenzyme A synthetase (ADP forming)-like protein